MQLPAALAPWASYLSLFPTVLSESLAPVVQRLERVLGPAESVMFSDSDEPEGYDGIARRGSYERLLISEWLLADELPDEFLRRHAAGEQSFLELARKTPTGQPRIVALFDSGPNQLGSPRIVHIAMLIVLARRADSMGRSIQWGILQKPDLGLYSGVTKSDLELLLEQRSIEEVTQANVQNWLEHCKGELANTYVIGGKRLAKFFSNSKAARLTVEDVLEPEVQALQTSFKAHGGKEVKFRLPLPAPSHCTRLLRDPFVPIPKATRTGKLNLSALPEGQIMHNGLAHFLARTGVGSVISYKTPRNPTDGTLKQRIYSNATHRPIIAAGIDLCNRAAILVDCEDEKTLRIEMIGGRDQYETIRAKLPFSLSEDEMAGNKPLVVLSKSPFTRYNERACLVLHEHLIEMRLEHSDAETCPILKSSFSSDLYLRGKGVIYARECVSADAMFTRLDYVDSGRTLQKKLPTVSKNIHIGYGGRHADSHFGLVAYETTGGVWTVADVSAETVIEVPLDSTVFGVVGKWLEKSPGLIVLDSTRKRPYILAPDWQLDLPESPEEITSICCNPNNVISYINTAGTLYLYWMDGDRWQKYSHSENRYELLDKGSARLI